MPTQDKHEPNGWRVIILGSIAAAGGVQLFAVPTPLVQVFTLWYLLVIPGMTFVKSMSLHSPLAEWVLAITLSIALDMIVVQLFLYANRYHPQTILGAIMLLNLFGWVALQWLEVVKQKNVAA